ncbi:anti-sigma factor domain-containing protein [Peribacillus cavernae]|uniref:Anti-sigma factor domain-containing protein n=1 Tax=Peribacillus cavernae TaxID=1674310 RepID=A0A433HPK7_9BACI|nr:anti-sigma factor domain-containing protein [Peribacillus cavernae]MDQ0217315.1 hypothetical protein [Peribacillus cavernae]RUQ30224.1 anti-sigma factor domain-containing protein [Peribacillus cavernae]
MKKGIILEMDNKFVTLLTPEGEFLKAPRKEHPYEIGAEVSYKQVKRHGAFSFFHISVKKTTFISAAAVIILILSMIPAMFADKCSAYLTIDVNPSIELGVNDQLEVIELEGLNQEGKNVISQLSDWDEKNIKTVTDKIVKTIKKLGYFKEHKEIVVSTTVVDKSAKLDKSIRQEISKTAALVPEARMKIVNGTQVDRDNAKEEGISTGKYLEKKEQKTDKNKIFKKPEKDKQQKLEEPPKQNSASIEERQKKSVAKVEPQKQRQESKSSNIIPEKKISRERINPQKNEKPKIDKTKPIIRPMPPSVKKNEPKHHEKNSFNEKRQEQSYDQKDAIKENKLHRPKKPAVPKNKTNFSKGKPDKTQSPKQKHGEKNKINQHQKKD